MSTSRAPGPLFGAVLIDGVEEPPAVTLQFPFADAVDLEELGTRARAVYRSREARANLCEGCYARLVREGNAREGVR